MSVSGEMSIAYHLDWGRWIVVAPVVASIALPFLVTAEAEHLDDDDRGLARICGLRRRSRLLGCSSSVGGRCQRTRVGLGGRYTDRRAAHLDIVGAADFQRGDHEIARHADAGIAGVHAAARRDQADVARLLICACDQRADTTAGRLGFKPTSSTSLDCMA